MAGDCDSVDRENLKCALEFSFIGLCKNIFGCNTTRITVHGKVVLKSNNEEMCTLNFDDIVTPGEYGNGSKNFCFNNLSTYYKSANNFSKSSNVKQQTSKVCNKIPGADGTVTEINFQPPKIVEERALPSEEIHFNVSKTTGFTEEIKNSDLSLSPCAVQEITTDLSNGVSQPATNQLFKTGEIIKENLNATNNKYINPDRIRCCACKGSDGEDGSWDDDKTSVVVDENEVSENIESGKLCLESLEDDEVLQGSSSLNGNIMTDLSRYASLLSKIKSHSDHSNLANAVSRDTNQSSLEQFEQESGPTFLNKIPDIQIINSMWTKNSRYRHVCLVCGMTFTFRTNLTRHTRKIHGCRP